MKKWICLAAALALTLAACGQPAAEVTPTAASTPTTQPTATAAVIPTTAVSAAPTASTPPEPTAAEVAATPTPDPTSTPTPEPTAAPTAQVVPTPSPEPTPEPVSTPEPTALSSAEPVASFAPERPSDEDVLGVYHQAAEAYTWFSTTTLPVDFTVTQLVGETPYNPVSDQRFPTMDALRGYLKTLFSDEIVDALLPIDGTHYVDIDGALYAAQTDRGTDIAKGGVVETIVWPEGEEPILCTVRAEVELLDENDLTTVVGTQIYEFPYQKVGDKWVFTYFGSIF